MGQSRDFGTNTDAFYLDGSAGLVPTDGAFTICTWMRRGAAGGAISGLYALLSSPVRNIFGLKNSNSRPYCEIASGVFCEGGTLSVGTDYHLAVTADASDPPNVSIWIDGSVVQTRNDTSWDTGVVDTWRAGNRGGSFSLSGNMCNILAFTEEMSSEKINEVMYNPASFPENQTLWLSCLDASMSSETDLSGSGHSHNVISATDDNDVGFSFFLLGGQ